MSEGDDLNSLTLNAVGSGSKLRILHIHRGKNGENFKNVTKQWFLHLTGNVAVTDTQDDSFDFDAGWSRYLQTSCLLSNYC